MWNKISFSFLILFKLITNEKHEISEICVRTSFGEILIRKEKHSKCYIKTILLCCLFKLNQKYISRVCVLLIIIYIFLFSFFLILTSNRISFLYNICLRIQKKLFSTDLAERFFAHRQYVWFRKFITQITAHEHFKVIISIWLWETFSVKKCINF